MYLTMTSVTSQAQQRNGIMESSVMYVVLVLFVSTCQVIG